MKKIVLLTGLFISVLFFSRTDAQVRLNVNVNIGSQPAWGPVGYNYVDYYYLPDIEVYYYVPTRQFIYLSGRNWVFSYNLPRAYRSYDLYSGYKVVINQPRPYLHHSSYRVKYTPYKGRHGQAVMKNKNYNHNKGRGHGRH